MADKIHFEININNSNKMILENENSETLRTFIAEMEKLSDNNLKNKFINSLDNYHQSLYNDSSKSATRIYMDKVSRYLKKTENMTEENILKDLKSEIIKESIKIAEYKGSKKPAKSYDNISLSPNKEFFCNTNYAPKDHIINLKKALKKIPEIKFFINNKDAEKIKKQIKNDEEKKTRDTIFFGPPGTGKSSKTKEIVKESKTYRVTFHPEYTYSDFLGQYKPVVGYQTGSHSMSQLKEEIYEVNGKVTKGKKPVVLYDFVPGVFTKAIIESFKNPEENIYLIIEEINRGNCAAIFGDIFQLLDRNKNENESEFPIDLPAELLDYLQSSYPEDENIQNIIKTEKLYLPRNFCILATMNTSDQSLFPMDSAFKRRWNMEYIPIDYQEKELKGSYFKIENKTHNWLEFLEKINNLIEETHNAEDKQIGQWFIKTNGIDENGTPFFNEENFKNKVLSYLFFDVFKFERSKIFKQSSFSKLIECNSLEEIFKDEVLNKNKEQKTNENLENND